MSVLRVAAIVVAYNGGDALGQSVKALRKSVYRPLDIVVVDNASIDDGIPRLERTGIDVLHLGENRGFAGGVNAGIRRGIQQRKSDNQHHKRQEDFFHFDSPP